MTTFKDIFYSVDVLFQFLLVSAMTTFGAMTLVDRDISLFFMTSMLFTGSWQLFSAVIWGAFFRQESKLLYLACAALYCVMLYFGLSQMRMDYNESWNSTVIFCFLGIIPMIAAGIYFWMTVQEPEAEVVENEEYV